MSKMTTKPPRVHPGSTLDGLPRSFVSSLRILFDVLDEEGKGMVHLSDIESRWQGDGIQELPSGVLEALRKVTPKNGYLSFERFCAGLKIALIRKRTETKGVVKTIAGPQNGTNQAPARAKSMPQLQDPLTKTEHARTHSGEGRQPPRVMDKAAPQIGPGGGNSKTSIVDALRSWQKEQLKKTSGSRESGDGRSTSNNDKLMYVEDRVFRESNKVGSSHEAPTANPTTKRSKNRRDPRRHTVANGIDYNMPDSDSVEDHLKRMKELEQEKDTFLQGLEVVDRARDWYHKQIVTIKDKQKYFNRTSTSNDLSSETRNERVKFQKSRILESNRQLTALMESSDKSFPTHMQLAVDHVFTADEEKDYMVKTLREQNRQLTKEVSEKGEKVTQLEREKQALIRELFEVRAKTSRPRDSADNTTFM